ncbi:sugar ABC transporter substrate-binding protein [Streptomyces spinoverrucosus]|uniref:Sugar ABC transporter substrate-binding protein n=1 Tax=Streptomyces spinoverrucosus TaxID=284043 RepID=A0A4Y3VEF4_9ACTN|nr:substrate-binding domain-containing protein [Streptomyces spinoverrucosus]GEC03971.1 sugar ABC transporter substrate-binding protein [Streptomyces spinoverrucosus]GHB49036.1 sugar ABC transporter substrate-binding protein [Streptomyces spinoverrucosus]
MHRNHRAAALTATLLAGALFAAGCSSGSGGKKSEEAAADATVGKADTPRMTVAMITHAAPGDTFWDLIRKGATAAAAKDNIKLVYSSDPNAGNQANLVQNAIDQKVDGIALTAAKPDAMKAVVAKATAAGIPVVGFNSGLDDWRQLGMLEYFGQDENIAGEAFGERLNQLGAKHALCVIQEQGQVALEARCAGLKKGFKGTTETLYVNGTDMPTVKSTLTAKLQRDSSIDQVVTLGAPFALTAVQSVKDSGSKAKVATFDLNKDLVQAVQDGSVEFAVDQQPYLQGYLAVDGLWLYRTNGNVSGGGTAPVLTGPAFVTKENVDSVAKFAANGTR